MEEYDLLDYVRKAESLDEALQLYTAFKTKQREVNWFEGDLLNALIEKFGPGVMSSCSQHGWGRKAHLEQIARVAKAFSSEERVSEIAWSWFRASYQASTRVKNETPFEILMKALDHDWKLSDIVHYGSPKPVEFILVEVCPECGTQFVMRRTELLTDTVSCPVCALQGEGTPLGTFVRKE